MNICIWSAHVLVCKETGKFTNDVASEELIPDKKFILKGQLYSSAEVLQPAWLLLLFRSRMKPA